MFQGRLINWIARAGACAVLVTGATLAKAETAQPKPKQDSRGCAAAYKSGQEREQAGHLVEANKLFLKCASPACGGALSQECAAKNIQLFSQLPTVVVLATDSTGEPLVDVEVKVDGELLTSRLDGLSLPLDPGTHEFTFSAGSSVFPPQKVTIVAGERNRPVSTTEEPERKSAQNGPISAAQPHP
jgi:hypothetical protein